MAVGADDAAIIAAGIQAAGAVGTTIAGSVKKRGSTRMMNVSKELARYNTELSENLYNKYQSPAAQVRQYREAGLNPNLLGNGAAAGSPSAGQVNTDAGAYGMSAKENMAALTGQAIRDAVGGIQSYLMNDAKISNDQASAEALRSQAVLNDLKSEGQRIQNSLDKVLSSYRVEEMNQSNALRAIELDVQNHYAMINARQRYVKLLEETDLTGAQRKEVMKRIDKYDQEIRESEARVRNMKDTIALGYGNLSLATDRFNFERSFQDHKQSYYQLQTDREFNLRSKQWQFDKKQKIASQLFNLTLPKQPIIGDYYRRSHGKKDARIMLDYYKNDFQ